MLTKNCLRLGSNWGKQTDLGDAPGPERMRPDPSSGRPVATTAQATTTASATARNRTGSAARIETTPKRDQS